MPGRPRPGTRRTKTPFPLEGGRVGDGGEHPGLDADGADGEVDAFARLGGEADSRPVKFGEVFATLYQTLGIDVMKATVPDLSGRPHYLVEPGCIPLPELVS